MVALVVLGVAGAAMRTVPPYQPGKRTPPVAPHEVAYTEHRLDVGGLKLLRRSIAPHPPQQPRGTLVLVHGLKDYSDRYQDFAVLLARRGFRVETFDLRGHGDSEGDRVRIESFDEYLSDLDKVMAEVRQNPTGPLFLFGHSMGGAIATRWTELRKPDLAGLILSAAALKLDVPGPAVAVVQGVGAIAPRAPIFMLDDSKFSRSPGVGAAMAKDPLIYEGGAPARTLAELAGAIGALRKNAALLEVPLLALHGSADEVTPPQGDQDLIAAASSKDKTAKVYPQLVHDLLHEPEAATVMADIAAWMEARAPAQPLVAPPAAAVAPPATP